MVEANLLGIKASREILENIINRQKNQKDNAKIVFNKQTKFSISKAILYKMFTDFEIIGTLKYDDSYNLIINTNLKFGKKTIKKQYKKVAKRINE